MKQSELAPGILVALPNLEDPYFSKTAILLCNYNEEGAFGLVMNHPSDLKVTEILKEEFQNHIDLEVPLLIGGPVQPESFWAVHTSDYLCESSTEISSRIALSAGEDVLMAILDGSGPQTYHLGVGYSGWGAFQLDREIQEESWWLAPLDESLIMDMEYDHRWECILDNLGISPYTALFTKSGHV
ncbi:MAG: YqgE/AlgH family protein [bacterium]